MRKLFLLMSVMSVLTCGSSAWASLYSGGMGYLEGDGVGYVNGGTLTGNRWAGGGAGFSWTVDKSGDDWNYSYHFEQYSNTKDVNTFNLQVASGFAMSDLKQASVSVTTGTSGNVIAPTAVTSPSVPVYYGLSGSTASYYLTFLNGLQWVFSGSSEYSFTVDLTTTRAPMWGDFLVSGVRTKEYSCSISDSDFGKTDTDSSLPQLVANTGYYGVNAVLVPKGAAAAPVPIPPSLLLFGSGLSGLFFFKRKKIEC